MSTSTNSQGRWEFDENGNVHYVPPAGEAPGTGQSRPQGQPRRQKKGDDGWHWLLIVLGFMVWWPAGLMLLFLQLGGKWPANKKAEQEFRRAATAAQNAAKQAQRAFQAQRQSTQSSNAESRRQAELAKTRAAQAKAQARTQERQNRRDKRQKKDRSDSGTPYGLGHVGLLRTIGGILAGLFGFAFVMELIDQLSYFYDLRYLLSETVPLLALCLIGVTLIGMAGSRKRKLKRFQKYRTMIGSRTIVPIASLAKAMGIREKKVEKDLEEMLERNFFEEGYVDAARRALVLGSPLEEEPSPQEPSAPANAPEDDAVSQATLRHIREINNAIANPELSDKITRIEELTAKIFRLLDERPEKAGELRRFMNYYLPQTLKILESYSKLEAQGIEGENIAEAKGKIESMMDKLVDGYETQLDKLFADDVLDISADLKVMESMLEKDGLTADSELHF